MDKLVQHIKMDIPLLYIAKKWRIVMDGKTETLHHLMKFCMDKINDMKTNENKGEYGTGCIDAWTEVVNEIDELLHPEIYQ